MRYLARQGKNLRIGFSATVSEDDTWNGGCTMTKTYHKWTYHKRTYHKRFHFSNVFRMRKVQLNGNAPTNHSYNVQSVESMRGTAPIVKEMKSVATASWTWARFSYSAISENRILRTFRLSPGRMLNKPDAGLDRADHIAK